MALSAIPLARQLARSSIAIALLYGNHICRAQDIVSGESAIHAPHHRPDAIRSAASAQARVTVRILRSETINFGENGVLPVYRLRSEHHWKTIKQRSNGQMIILFE